MKQILIDFSPFLVKTALMESGRLVEIIVDSPDTTSLVGNIYAAKVVDVVKSQFAFVAIGESKNGFLQLDDHRQRGLSCVTRGSRVLVQVLRDPLNDKGAMLSGMLSFSGRLLVLTKSADNESEIRISNKITSRSVREYLRELCESLCPEGFGIIVRTEAANADPREISLEIERLSTEAIKVIEQAKGAPMPSLLYGNEKIYTRALKALLDVGAKRIVTNGNGELDYIRTLASEYVGVLDVELDFDFNDTNAELMRALRQKVWLKSGAYILIEETQTCTYIDVNTGKFLGKKDSAATANYVNVEAAKEIAAQVRFRNISGIIIVDFVGAQTDLDNSRELIEAFKTSLGQDRTPATITDWSELNVAILTRKYGGVSLKNILTGACPSCSGTGRISSATFFADIAYKEIIKIYSGGFCGKIRVNAHEDIVKILENDPLVRELTLINVVKDAPNGFYELIVKHP